MRDEILAATKNALRTAAEPRFFRTERGYHGRFYCTLHAALDRKGLLRGGAILEMEYQKGTRHNLTQRPDIIFHIPAEDSRSHVRSNNLAVWALKRRASRNMALEDFRKLDEMCDRLDYPLAIFINIDSELTHRSEYDGRFADRLYCFGVVLVNGAAEVLES